MIAHCAACFGFDVGRPGKVDVGGTDAGFELDAYVLFGDLDDCRRHAGAERFPVDAPNGGIDAAKHFMAAEAQRANHAGVGIEAEAKIADGEVLARVGGHGVDAVSWRGFGVASAGAEAVAVVWVSVLERRSNRGVSAGSVV